MGDRNKTRSMSTRSSNGPQSVIASGNASGGSNGLERVYESGQMMRLQKMQKDLDETLARVNRLKLDTQSPAPQAPKMDTGSSLIAPAAVIDTGPKVPGKKAYRKKPKPYDTTPRKLPYTYNDADDIIKHELVSKLRDRILITKNDKLLETLRAFVDAPYDLREYELDQMLEYAKKELAKATDSIERVMKERPVKVAPSKVVSMFKDANSKDILVSDILPDNIFQMVQNGEWDGGYAFYQNEDGQEGEHNEESRSEIYNFVMSTIQITELEKEMADVQEDKKLNRLAYNLNWTFNLWEQDEHEVPLELLGLGKQVLDYIDQEVPEAFSWQQLDMLFEAAGGEDFLYEMCLVLENENEEDYVSGVDGANQLYMDHTAIEAQRVNYIDTKAKESRGETIDSEAALADLQRIRDTTAALTTKKDAIVQRLKGRNNRIHFYIRSFAMVMEWPQTYMENRYKVYMTTHKRRTTLQHSQHMLPREYMDYIKSVTVAREYRKRYVDPWLGVVIPSGFTTRLS